MGIDKKNSNIWSELQLDYIGESQLTSFYTSNRNLHTYPAKAMPKMVAQLIICAAKVTKVKVIADPFVGGGTTALEAKYAGCDFYGSDLNPLAVLLTRTKLINTDVLQVTKKNVYNMLDSMEKDYKKYVYTKEPAPWQEYWFKAENIAEMQFIKETIDKFLKHQRKKNREYYALLLLTAFSTTIRRVSLSRNSEYKLYRISPRKIREFNINAIERYVQDVKALYDTIEEINYSCGKKTKNVITMKNAKSLDYIQDGAVDLVLTSPPYGDSKTTVAYGEFSRLSIQWMGELLENYLKLNAEKADCDSRLLGGKESVLSNGLDMQFFHSETIDQLNDTISQTIKAREKELDEVTKTLFDLLNNENLSNTEFALLLKENDVLYQLVYERVRLDIYRKINNAEKTKLEDKYVKGIAKNQAKIYMDEACDVRMRKCYKRQGEIRKKLKRVEETIVRNKKSLPKRKKEINFFIKDLYGAVLESDRILKQNGLQIWIVGHRTIFGSIVINLEGVLADWFENLGYTKEAAISRAYSFKRMPYHINSTIERSREVSTMMNEHVLIMRKGNSDGRRNKIVSIGEID